jgi:uncharacterized membrane protein YoaK (UPF0700 family)
VLIQIKTFFRTGIICRRSTLLIKRKSDVSTQQVAAASFRSEETLRIASLLAFSGGYLEAYTWIVHRVFANAQTANLVFLWINVTGGEWAKALHYVPPLLAFSLGVVMASLLKWFAPQRASRISSLVEIVFLFIVAVLHNRLPGVAGTLGISFVAALQTASFPKVEGWNYSSVMATNNFRQAVEGLFIAFAGSAEARPFRRPHVFGVICVAFGAGAAIGAGVTERLTRDYSLAIPVALLAIVLLRWERILLTSRDQGRLDLDQDPGLVTKAYSLSRIARTRGEPHGNEQD